MISLWKCPLYGFNRSTDATWYALTKHGMDSAWLFLTREHFMFYIRKTLYMVLLVSWVIFALPAAGQDAELVQEVTLSDGTVVSVPQDWRVETLDFGVTATANDELLLLLLTPAQVAALVEIPADANAAHLVTPLGEALGHFYTPESRMRIIDVGDRFAAGRVYQFEGERTGIVLVVPLTEGGFGAVDALSLIGSIDESLEQVKAIAGSFAVGDGTTTVTPTAEAAVSVEPCFISAEGGAALRVGPGLNRTIVAFLQSGQSSAAIGRFVGGDGSIWYQLDKAEVLPTSAANELWVSGAEVQTAGDCEAVADAAAPPIVLPRSTQLPPSDTDTTGS